MGTLVREQQRVKCSGIWPLSLSLAAASPGLDPYSTTDTSLIRTTATCPPPSATTPTTATTAWLTECPVIQLQLLLSLTAEHRSSMLKMSLVISSTATTT